jgi:DNA (cytosine-5)-methyltransferase 1
MRIGSLFSGVGGLDLGLEWAGVGETVWQVEKDEYARSVLARHWPDARRFDDIRTVGSHNLSNVDVLCGGFPCPDISYAGKGAGLAGERSGLWFEYARIIRELRPEYIVVENVSALRTRGLDAVTSEISALGYDMWWDCIPASSIGAPQQRDRLFIVAWRRMADADGQGLQGFGSEHRLREAGSAEQSSGSRGGSNQSRLVRNAHGLSDWLDKGWPNRPKQQQKPWEPQRIEALVGPSKKRKDRLRCIGNAVAPPVGYFIGCMLMWIHDQRQRQRSKK